MSVRGFVFAFCLSFHASLLLAWEVLPEKPPIPQDNPQTEAKIHLGRLLYFDPRLSKTEKVSCNTCHDLTGSGTGADSGPVSVGIDGKKGRRNSPTVWNSAFWSVQFWDGRAPSLEEQAKGPMINPVEMGMESHDVIVKKIEKIPGYQKAFKDAFGEGPITIGWAAKAIAAYERTLITPNSAFDRYKKGDTKALSASAVRGMGLVQSVGCISCHSGPHFNGPQLPMGTGFYMKFPTIPGRYTRRNTISPMTWADSKRPRRRKTSTCSASPPGEMWH